MQAWPDMSLRVLHIDDDLVAIDKPPGLLVHPSTLDAHEARSALALLRTQLGVPLWTVHRLDKATSGVLIFARSLDAARAIGAAFEGGAVHKRYLALVRVVGQLRPARSITPWRATPNCHRPASYVSRLSPATAGWRATRGRFPTAATRAVVMPQSRSCH